MAGVNLELAVLAEREQPARKWRWPVDADERLRADWLRMVRAEQGMSAIDTSHLDRGRAGDHPPNEGRLDSLDTGPVGPEAPLSNEECNRGHIDPKDFRPVGRDDGHQRIDRGRFDCCQHCQVDRPDRARMASGKRDEILVGLFDGSKSFAELRNRALFEVNKLAHGQEASRKAVNFLWLAGLRRRMFLRHARCWRAGQMMTAILALVSGTVTAAAPITPLPWFEFRDYPMRAFEKNWEGVTKFELLVAPDGRIAGCTIISSSGHEELDKTSCFLASKRVTFRPATGPGGQPQWGVYRTQALWALPDRKINAAPGPDLEISLNKLPDGVTHPAAVKLAYAVDARGNASSCTVMPSSLRQPDVLVEIGCKELLQSANGKPVIGPGGQPVAAVKTGAVLFNPGR